MSTFYILLAIIIAYRFEEVEVETKRKTTVSQSIKDIKQGFGFIIKSNRLKALFLFTSIFVGVLHMISTYEKSLLNRLKVSPQYFVLFFAILTLVQCFSVKYQDKIHTAFKNRTLAFISIPIFVSFIIVGVITKLNFNFAFYFTHSYDCIFYITFLEVLIGY